MAFVSTVDRAARETAVAAAALRLIARDGDAALTVRRVAAEAQIPPSSLREIFPSQNAVRVVMMGAVAERLRQRVDVLPSELGGAQWGRAALMELLPVSHQRRQEAIATAHVGAAALHDPDLRAAWKLADDVVRETCSRALDAMEFGGSSVRLDQMHSLIDGLTGQMLLQADGRPAGWGAEVLDRMLRCCAVEDTGRQD